jgi:hypothetical protein
MTVYYQDGIGYSITYDTGATNINASADFTLFVEEPDGATTTWTLLTGELNLTTGIATHTSVSGELTKSGEYQLQGKEVRVGTRTRFFPVTRIVVNRKIVP